MKNLIKGIILISAFGLSSCKTVNTAENSKKANIKQIVKSEEVVLLDVRIPEQYEKETAKNAINIPLAEIENEAESLKGKKVVVFCNKGIQADQAYDILKKKGVEVYDGTTLDNVKAIQQEK